MLKLGIQVLGILGWLYLDWRVAIIPTLVFCYALITRKNSVLRIVLEAVVLLFAVALCYKIDLLLALAVLVASVILLTMSRED